jgi:hypothetical protein
MQCSQERRLRSLLIHRAATHEDFAESWHVHETRLPRRRRPLLGVRLLHVVHEIQPERAARTGVECREDAGLAVGRPLLDVLEPGIAQHAHREIAALAHPAILGSDRRLTDPRLQPLHGFIVTLLDLLVDRRAVRCRARASGGEHRAGRQARAEESSA